jgi:hypothetical protein
VAAVVDHDDRIDVAPHARHQGAERALALERRDDRDDVGAGHGDGL